MNDVPEPLAALLRRYHAGDGPAGDVPRASLAEALRGGSDPLQVVDYLRGLGLPVRDLEDLLAINADPDEEELHAFRVAEGVAVTVASQGDWALYTE
jgi:hypothetical protein